MKMLNHRMKAVRPEESILLSNLETVPARHIYAPREIVFSARLADILRPTDDGSFWMIDSAQFDGDC